MRRNKLVSCLEKKIVSILQWLASFCKLFINLGLLICLRVFIWNDIRADCIYLGSFNLQCIEVWSIDDFGFEVLLAEARAVCQHVFHVLEVLQVVLEVLLPCSLIKCSDSCIFLLQEFEPLLELLVEVLINSSPLAKEFAQFYLLLLIKYAQCIDHSLIQEGFGICEQELRCMSAQQRVDQNQRIQKLRIPAGFFGRNITNINYCEGVEPCMLSRSTCTNL